MAQTNNTIRVPSILQYWDGCDKNVGYNDLILAADSGHFMSALCLLDLTAAFDTVDHDLLTLRLERQFGLRGIVLQ